MLERYYEYVYGSARPMRSRYRSIDHSHRCGVRVGKTLGFVDLLFLLAFIFHGRLEPTMHSIQLMPLTRCRAIAISAHNSFAPIRFQ